MNKKSDDLDRTRYLRVRIKKILIPPIHDAVDESAIAAIAESMAKSGLFHPIAVRRNEKEIVLVAGALRLEAAKRLDWSEIDCLFVDGEEGEAEFVRLDADGWRHLRPKFIEVPDYPVLKNERQDGKLRQVNGGLHLHALALVPPRNSLPIGQDQDPSMLKQSRLHSSLAEHLDQYRKLYCNNRLYRIHAKETSYDQSETSSRQSRWLCRHG